MREPPSEWDEARGKALQPTNPGAQIKALLQEASSALRQDNLGELYARRYFKSCIDGIMAIAENDGVDPEVRRKAFMDVYAIAFGRPATVIRVPGDSHVPPTIDSDVRQAVAAAEVLGLAASYASTPPEDWPTHVREALDKAGEAGLGTQPRKP